MREVLSLNRCCGKGWKNGFWGVYWVAVTSGKRLGVGIEGNEEGVVKEWKNGKEFGRGSEVCTRTWRGLDDGMEWQGSLRRRMQDLEQDWKR